MKFDSSGPATELGAGWIAAGGTRADRAVSRWLPAVIVLATAIYLCCAPFAISHLDFARDAGVALGIANGERWPLYGPLLNGNLHLGPAWYYLLAAPLWLTHSWIVVVMMIASIAALKFPLAYALGSRLVDPWFGVLWALMLGLPGWNSLDALLMEHTSFVATCVLGFFWMLVRYAETSASRHFYGLALLYALSLHAHPSTYALALVAVPLIARPWWASPAKWRDLAVAALVFLVPFAPFLASQLAAGSPDIRGAFDYLATGGGLGKISDIPAVTRGMLVTGPELIARSVLGIHGPWAEAYSIVYGLLWATVAAGLVTSLSSWATRRVAMIGVAIVVCVAVSVVLIRAVTPYYMSFVVLTLVSGLAALGLRSAMTVSVIRYLAYGVTAVVAVLPIVLAIGAARTFSDGLYPFAVWPLFDIKKPYQEGPPLPFAPAYALASIGDTLCANRTVVAHGALAFHLLHDYGLETKLQCAAPPAIKLGGVEPIDAAHVAGLSRVMLRGAQRGATGFDSIVDAGPLSLFAVRRVINPAAGESPAAPGTFPPTRYTFGAPARVTLQFDARCDEIVVVTNMYYAFASDPKVVAILNGNTVQPAAADALSAAYVCSDARESTASWRRLSPNAST